ncbi:MFS transporter small subunit [Microbacterium paludicola]
MSEQNTTGSGAPASQTVRLVVSWLIVGVPLVYALVQTITSVMPLFTG